MVQFSKTPDRKTYDVIIIGGAMVGASIAWFLTDNPDFNGTILVVEKDPTYEFSSTAHTNSCMRQQFSNPINVQMSQFAADFVKNFRDYMGGDARVPDIPLQSYGYMYLAGTQDFADTLKQAQILQAKYGAGTKYMSAKQIQRDYPFYNVDDIIGGNHNLIDEGYFDGNTLFDWWKRSARERGAEYIHNTVVDIVTDKSLTSVSGIALETGEVVSCGTLINASGPRAAITAKMAGIHIPVEPRKRYTFIFDAQNPLDRDLPLTIDPSGIHVRTDGTYYMAGCPPDEDESVEPDDFVQDHDIWEQKVWPALAHRIPQFEAIKLINSWAGHYAFNVFDQNAIIGPHSKLGNFIFANGFSGHGFQQSPAVGRGVAEWVTYGAFKSLDLSPFRYERILKNEPFIESAVI